MSLKEYEDNAENTNRQCRVFEKLYSIHWEALYQKALSIIQNKALAADIVQDVWTDFWEYRNKIEDINIEGYLFNSLRFRIFKEFRKQKYNDKLVQDFIHIAEDYKVDDSIVDYNDTLDILYKTVESFPDKCKEVFILSRFKGMKNSEIAKKLNISQRTVETHISKGLKILKKNLPPALIITLLIHI